MKIFFKDTIVLPVYLGYQKVEFDRPGERSPE